MTTSNADVVRAHVLFLRRCDARPATIHARAGVLRRLAAALPLPLLDADTEVLWSWIDDVRPHLAVESVRCYTAHIRAFYAWARRQGLVIVDPAADIHAPRVPIGRARPIPEDALRVAIRCAREPVRTWLILAAFCGLRAGEIARLRRDDIHDEVLDVDGKGGRSRVVPLPADVRALLLGHVHGPGAIWRKLDGDPMSPEGVSRRCCDHLRATGSDATLHKLRHRYATRLYELSKDPLLVQKLLGHASLATTQVYLGVDASRARGVTDQLAETLPPLVAAG